MIFQWRDTGASGHLVNALYKENTSGGAAIKWASRSIRAIRASGGRRGSAVQAMLLGVLPPHHPLSDLLDMLRRLVPEPYILAQDGCRSS